MNKNNFQKRLKELVIGKKTLKERLLTALFPSLVLSFILFFFGPLDLSMIAESYVDYTVLDILPTCLKIWGITFLGFFLVSWIPGGKLHVWISSLFSGLAIALYIQGNWLNIDLGALDGTAIEWQKYGDNAIINFAVFSLIVLIPFMIHFFSRKAWKSYVIFTSILLLLMQIVPLSVKLVQYRQPEQEVHYRVNKDKEYVLGKENIVVFILDITGPEQLSYTLQRYPDTLDPFHDFTYYDNYNTEYVGTFPAAAMLLTHQPYDPEIPVDQWFTQIWHAEETTSFYNQMEEAGWITRAFHSIRHVSGTSENEYGKISNIERVDGPQEFTINKNVFRKLIKLSFYRYIPLIMKPSFWISTSELSGMKNLTDNEEAWNKINSIGKYLDERLSVGDEEKVYITYHYAGAHAPHLLDATGKPAVRVNDGYDQLAGHFYVLSEYIQQMKDYHIYDSSTIIITTDHGTFEYPHGILFIKLPGQRQTEMTVSHAPLTQSDFMETIAELAGLEKGQFGKSFFDIEEDEERYRCEGNRWEDPELAKIPGKSSNAMKMFCYTGDSDTLHQMIRSDEYTENYPLPYPFY